MVMLFKNRKEQKETRSCSVGKDKWEGKGAYLKQNKTKNTQEFFRKFQLTRNPDVDQYWIHMLGIACFFVLFCFFKRENGVSNCIP